MSEQNFSALNGQIIEPRSIMGRPQFAPTDEQRRIVEGATSAGLNQETVADFLGIHRDTLRKHFARELAAGKFKADLRVGQNLVALASKEDFRAVPAIALYAKAKMGFTETVKLSPETGTDSGTLDLSALSDAELEALIAIRAKMIPALESQNPSESQNPKSGTESQE